MSPVPMRVLETSEPPDPEAPDPVAIVHFYPNPLAVLRAYVESDFARELATEHERQVQALAAEGADVVDATSFARVGERLVDVATHRKQVEAWFEPITNWAFRMHRAICDRKNEVLKPLTAFEQLAKGNWDRFRREDEQKRRDEEARLAEIARKDEQTRLEREAALLEQRGETQLAAQVFEQAIATPAPVISITSALPKVKGLSPRENWKWRPIGGDTPENRARAEKLVPREYLELSDRKLTAMAKAHKGSLRIPGIEFYDAGSVSVR